MVCMGLGKLEKMLYVTIHLVEITFLDGHWLA